jgi:hypothetical protein
MNTATVDAANADAEAPFDADQARLPAIQGMNAFQQVALYDRIADPMDAVVKFGDSMFRSGMFGCQTPDQGRMLALVCMSERKSPTEIMRTYHIIENKLSMRADAMLAIFRMLGGEHEVLHRTPEIASIRLIDGKTRARKQTDFTFTWEEAQQEPFPYGKPDKDGKPVLKKNWATPRARMQMLWARVVSDAVRTLKPEVNWGVYTPEETADFGDDIPGASAPPKEPAGKSEAANARRQAMSEVAKTTVDVASTPAAEATKDEAIRWPYPSTETAATAEKFLQQGAAATATTPLDTTVTKVDQLRWVKQLKEASGITQETYLAGLTKLGVTTAKDLDETGMSRLIGWLEKLKKDRESNEWANNLGAEKPAEGNSGN